MRPLLATPQRAVVDGNVVAYGLFDEPFRDLNLLDAELPGIPTWLRRFRLKRWQHFAVITDECFLAFVVNTTHYMATSFCYVADRATAAIVEHSAEALPSATTLPRELYDGTGGFSKRGYRIDLENRLVDGIHRARIDIAATRRTPAIRANLTFHEELGAVQPLVAVLEVSPNRPLHTHKVACPASGEIWVGDRRIELDRERDLVIVDVQNTYYPYSTVWRWATCAGYDKQGRLLAINLVRNMLPNQETNNENCLWVDGRLTPWGGAAFEFDPNNVTGPWQVTTSDHKCKVRLQPIGERAGKLNLGLVMSDYHAPIGLFSGTVVDAEGIEYAFDDLFGIAEYHRARF